MPVKVTDRGYEALKKRVFGKAKPSVEVGIFEAEGQELHKDSLLTVLEVATFNEFGLGVPERSFLRAYIDENRERLIKMSAVLMQGVVSGKYTKEQACELLGLKMAGEIQKRISAGIAPENAPSTIAQKGSSKPLIDTGQLRSAITYRVKSG